MFENKETPMHLPFDIGLGISYVDDAQKLARQIFADCSRKLQV